MKIKRYRDHDGKVADIIDLEDGSECPCRIRMWNDEGACWLRPKSYKSANSARIALGHLGKRDWVLCR